MNATIKMIVALALVLTPCFAQAHVGIVGSEPYLHVAVHVLEIGIALILAFLAITTCAHFSSKRRG